jgi:hypothetical protein
LLDDARGYFFGVQFTVADIEEARKFLADEGLITGMRSMGRPSPSSMRRGFGPEQSRAHVGAGFLTHHGVRPGDGE